MIETLKTDMLIIGSGGAGLFAALHAAKANPDLDITLAVKGLVGKSGCTRMVQGGYNVAVAAGDSIERHFMDTIVGGKWLPHQDLAWASRQRGGEMHPRARERVWLLLRPQPGRHAAPEGLCRAELRPDSAQGRSDGHRDHQPPVRAGLGAQCAPAGGAPGGGAHPRPRTGLQSAGVLLIDIRQGHFRFVQAKTVLLGAGGGPTMYRYHTPSGDKACDGMAMGLRAGLALRDMEMVQFHPTGILAGNDTRMTGTILEEGSARCGRLSAQRCWRPLHVRVSRPWRTRDARYRVPRHV